MKREKKGTRTKYDRMKKVYVAGSFNTLRDIYKVVKLQRDLKEKGIDVLNQLEPFDYTRLYDFTEERELAGRIVNYDLSLLEKADIVLALGDKASFGTGAEVLYAKKVLGKKVMAIVTKPARSPWIVVHADVIIDKLDVQAIVEAINNLMCEE